MKTKLPTLNTIPQNILWARSAAAFLVRLGERLPDLLRFYAEEWGKMRDYDRDEILDYLRDALADRDFSLKGRTFGSLRKLSQEWHRIMFVGKVRDYRWWPSGIELWEHRKGSSLVRAFEITNNRALADEGRRQRHCVFIYASRCLAGRTRIVSMRWHAPSVDELSGWEEVSRLTVEISMASREIVQIRGRLNRRASDDEMKLVRMWAGERGFTVGPYALD